MYKLALAVCCGLILKPLASFAACPPEQVAVRDFVPEVDDWSDGSGKVVRLSGRIETACSSPTDVELSIVAKGGNGSVVQQKQTWMNAVPPGGQAFDFTGALPYDPAAVSYEIGVVRTR